MPLRVIHEHPRVARAAAKMAISGQNPLPLRTKSSRWKFEEDVRRLHDALRVIREHTRCARALASSPSALRASGPTPQGPFLARIRYFYGRFEHPMSDIIGHGLENTLETGAKQLQPLYTNFDPITPPRSRLRSKNYQHSLFWPESVTFTHKW